MSLVLDSKHFPKIEFLIHRKIKKFMNQEKPREYKQCIYSGPALERTSPAEEILRFRQPLSFEKTRSLKFPSIKNFLVRDFQYLKFKR